MCLVIVNCVDHVTTPGGTVTVSPSDALAIAAATFASWASMAGHVAPYINGGTTTGTTIIPKKTQPCLKMERFLRRGVGRYFISSVPVARRPGSLMLPRLGQAPREQRRPGPI